MKTKRRYWSLIPPLHAPVLTQVASQAEQAGLEGIWGIQLYGPPFIPLAAAATVTKRLKLGTGVALAFTRSPLETALSAIDLDIISGGRTILGLGPSLRWWNESWHGVTYGKPLTHLREVISIVRQLIAGAHTGDLGKIAGEYHQLDLTGFQNPTAAPRPAIPIYVPAVFENAVRLAGDVADGLVGHPIWSQRWIHNEVRHALQSSLQKAGRKREEFDLNIWAWVAINKDRRQAIEDARATVAFYSSFSQYDKYYAAHGFGKQARAACEAAQRKDVAASLKAIPDEMVDAFSIAGTPDEVRERVEDLWRIADSLTLAAPFYGLEAAKVLGYQQAIAETFYA